MNRHMRTFLLGGLIFLLAGISIRAELPDQTKDQEQFFKAKALVFAGDWAGVRTGMEAYLTTYPSGKMEDEALFWLARSLDRLAREAGETSAVIDLKRQAFACLDRLIKKYPESLWRDDAREFQVAVAGSLAVLGGQDQQKFLEDVVAAGGKNGNQIKTAALRSILALDTKTVLAVLGNFLKVESDRDMRKQAVMLLGEKNSRAVLPLLSETQKNDPDAEVRKEAGAWIEKIRIRLIPVQVQYYAFDTTVTDVSQSAKVPEGQVVRFAVPHGRTGSEARAKREIERLFDGGLEFKGSKATMTSSALEEMGMKSSVSHLIGEFRIMMAAESLVKTERAVSGQLRFGTSTVPFEVDQTKDLILAARRGNRQTVVFLEMSPATPVEEIISTKSLDISSPPTRPSGKAGQEPVYYSTFNIKGAVISSSRKTLESGDAGSNLFDYGLAKAEMPGQGGTWTLVGEILQLVKENVLIGRRAKLIRPDGATAAEGAEIRVPIGNPERFNQAPQMEKAAPDAAEAVYRFDNGGWIRSSQPASALGEASLLNFGAAAASLPGPGGVWTLKGRLTLLVSSGQIMAYQAVLTDPKGTTAAEAPLIFVPVKNPDKFNIAVERII